MGSFKSRIGKSYPLGSHYDGEGVNFALFSAHAIKVELCIFNESGSEEIERYSIDKNTDNIWHIYLEGAKPGLVYGYRVYGLYKPSEGYRFNPHKLLIDPYGKKLVGTLIWNKAIFGYDIDSPDKDLSFSELDSAPYVPKNVVVDDNDYNWEDDSQIGYQMNESIIYETHLRGATKLNPFLPDTKRGTFAGFSDDSTVNYLKHLGVTSVEFLPVHAFFGNRHKRGYIIDNYWGYESFSFFAPEQSYLSNGDINEIRDMVKKLHKHGIEVLLDVVYNHTGEGNHLGPTLCYRGIDNLSYYILNPDNKRTYHDTTGCGASFNLQNPNVLRLVMDSLRYWVEKMHVDGFRFDLATTLCRRNNEFKQTSGFLYAVAQDEILKKVKIIAEPWDVGYGGYQLGAFLPGWSEWNDKYRDNIRRFWKGDQFQIAEIATRLTGSSEIFNHSNRTISSSINFITAHDGFTLNDLVSYNTKHNSANGESNRDGTDTNWSWNSGEEGETANNLVQKNRFDRMKAMLSTLMLSFGTPMLVFGDEFARSQMGNNNPYCQDNAITWVAWEGISSKQRQLISFVRKLIRLRKKLKIFSREQFFTGKIVDEQGYKDIAWYTEKGSEFSSSDWHDGNRHSISYLVKDNKGFVMAIFNGSHQPIDWLLPPLNNFTSWNVLLDSSNQISKDISLGASKKIKVPAWSVVLIEIK
ncbi:MAG: glycogen debranching protein GlgX [Alphaproteobacteria bacterium]|nr:glycogen debranching protein GlgX [Alphaproteobacteria bacterium]